MRIFSGIPPRSRYLERGAAEPSREAQKRLQWFDHYQAHGRNAALTCRYFGISRQTFYRWKRRYDPEDLRSLEDGSHRPHRRRRPTWTVEQAELGQGQAGGAVAAGGLGRILTSLGQRGALTVPVLWRVKRRRGSAGRPWALRQPKDDAVEKPGDLVQLDTMDLRPAPGVVLKQFTARDMVSRWDVIEVHHRATSSAATLSLDTLQQRLPFPLRALQVDGGSEFAALFEAACQQRGLRLFVLPPRSPKLNGQVERANRTHTEEFYELTPCSLPIAEFNRELQTWERTYNTVRPQQALGYLTPQEFLARSSSPAKGP